jgi:WD40 repeat protein
VHSLAVLQNGYLASSSQDKTIKIWNADTGSLIRTLTGHTNNVWSLAVLQNGYLASCSDDTTIKI